MTGLSMNLELLIMGNGLLVKCGSGLSTMQTDTIYGLEAGLCQKGPLDFHFNKVRRTNADRSVYEFRTDDK